MQIIISQPMKGLTEEQIRINRSAVVAELEAQGHTIIDSIFPDFPSASTKNVPLYFLGRSFMLIAEQADAVYFMNGWQEARGCKMEYEACKEYGVQIITQ